MISFINYRLSGNRNNKIFKWVLTDRNAGEECWSFRMDGNRKAKVMI